MSFREDRPRPEDRSRRRYRLATGLVVVLAAAAAGSGLADAPNSSTAAQELEGLDQAAASRKIEARIQRLQQEAAGTQAEGYAALVRDSWERGSLFLAVARLASVEPLVAADRYVAANPSVTQGDEQALRAQYERVQPELAARLDRLDGSTPPGPAALRAVVEATLQEARAYLGASLAYGLADGNESGMTYLGITGGELEVASFLQGAGLPVPGRAPAIPPMGPFLDEFEGKLLAAYVPPASIDHHRDFIQASASLKLARELDEAGHREGALYELLDARMRLGYLSPPAAGDAGERTQRVEAISARLDEGGIDHSLGLVFLGRARMGLGDAASAEDQVAAEIVLRDVLPFYLQVLEAAPSTPPVAAAAAGPVVRVTLVRWPYT